MQYQHFSDGKERSLKISGHQCAHLACAPRDVEQAASAAIISHELGPGGCLAGGGAGHAVPVAACSNSTTSSHSPQALCTVVLCLTAQRDLLRAQLDASRRECQRLRVAAASTAAAVSAQHAALARACASGEVPSRQALHSPPSLPSFEYPLPVPARRHVVVTFSGYAAGPPGSALMSPPHGAAADPSSSPRVLARLAEWVRALGGEVQPDTRVFDSRITHVVAARGSRTMKVLAAGLTGRWIMDAAWIQASHAAGAWLAEADFGQRHSLTPFAGKTLALSPRYASGAGAEHRRQEALHTLFESLGRGRVLRQASEAALAAAADFVLMADDELAEEARAAGPAATLYRGSVLARTVRGIDGCVRVHHALSWRGLIEMVPSCPLSPTRVPTLARKRRACDDLSAERASPLKRPRLAAKDGEVRALASPR